jgi:hypothetical protein
MKYETLYARDLADSREIALRRAPQGVFEFINRGRKLSAAAGC